MGAYKRIRAHHIPVIDGRLNFEEADRIWYASLNPAKVRGGEAGGSNGKMQPGLFADEELPPPSNGDAAAARSTFATIQRTRELLRIKREQITIAALEGKLVSLHDVRQFEGQQISQVKNALLTIGGELRDELAASTDPVECQALVDTRIHQALRLISQWKPQPK